MNYLEAWFIELAQLPSDHERDVAFFCKTGEDIADLGFWDASSHLPVHPPKCDCRSIYGCGFWKRELISQYTVNPASFNNT